MPFWEREKDKDKRFEQECQGREHTHHYSTIKYDTLRSTRTETVGGQEVTLTICRDKFKSVCECGDVSTTWEGSDYTC